MTLLRRSLLLFTMALTTPAWSEPAPSLQGSLSEQIEWLDQLRAVGRSQEANWHLEQALKAAPNDADLHYLHGRLQGDIAKAEAAFRKALVLQPAHAHAHTGLGMVMQAKGEARKAVGHFQQALKVDLGLAEAWEGLTITLLSLNDREGALQVARAATVQVPELPQTWLTLALLSPPEERLRLLQDGHRNARPHAALELERAQALLWAGHTDRARKAIDLCLALAPGQKDAEAFSGLVAEVEAGRLNPDAVKRVQALPAMATMDPKAALREADALVKDHPKSHHGWYLRGRALSGSNPGKARNDLEKALSLAPADPEVHAALGIHLSQTGHHAKAVDLLLPLMSHRPDNGDVAGPLGRSMVASGRSKQMLPQLQSLRNKHPDAVALVILHAQALADVDELEAAWVELSTAADSSDDLRLKLAAAKAAMDADHDDEAIRRFQELYRRTGDPQFEAQVQRLRGE